MMLWANDMYQDFHLLEPHRTIEVAVVGPDVAMVHKLTTFISVENL